MKTIKIEIKLDLLQFELLSQESERHNLKMMQKNSMKLLLKLMTNE